MGTRQTQKMTAREMQVAMRQHRVRQADLAFATGLTEAAVSRVLSGTYALDAARKARFEQALADLGVTAPSPSRRIEPTFDVPVATAGE
jgi:transcriptional regulator with XRE-family HTH domain